MSTERLANFFPSRCDGAARCLARQREACAPGAAPDACRQASGLHLYGNRWHGADTYDSMTALGDDRLWRLTGSGQAEAFGELFDRHHGAIYNFAFRRTGDWSAAEDIVGLVFLEAWRRRADVQFVNDSLRPWLFGVARNVVRNRWRSQRRHRAALERLRQQRHHTQQHEDDTVARLDDEARMRRLLELVSRLPASQREVLQLCVWEELSYEEAAVALNLPVGTVKSRLFRARQSLASSEALAELPQANGHMTSAESVQEETGP